jgi:hypothetical protein
MAKPTMFKKSYYLLLLAILMLVQLTLLPIGRVNAAADYPLASDRAYTWLKAQQDLTAGFAADGMVDSFDDWWNANDRIQIVYTYDQAVAAIAFMLKNDRVRAEKLLTKMSQFQDPDGSWINSYWWNGAGEEIRKHVGPVAWMSMAYMMYEKKYGSTTYRTTVKKSLDWIVSFQKPNGGISGGTTTWDNPGVVTNEVWTSTEHNQDVYNLLLYYANIFPDRTTTYNNAATGVKSFLDNVVWNDTLKRWNGGWKNNTNLIDPFVPMDVNPWGVLALGLSGTRDYKQSIAFVDNANGSGTPASPKYVHTLTYDGAGNLMTAYDFDWQYDCAAATTPTGGPNGQKCADIWLEGSAFMSTAHFMNGNTAKANSILDEIIKKQGTSGTLLGGLPYSLKASNNNYWQMKQENSVSSTGWLIIAIARFNPFTGDTLAGGGGGGTPSISSLSPITGPSGTSVTITGANFGATKGASTVKFGATTAATTAWSATSITATVPAGLSAGAASVTVTVGGTASNASAFTVTTGAGIPSNVFYVRSGGSLSFTAGSSAASEAIPSAGGINYDGTPHSERTYTISGINGVYDSTKSTAFNLFIDAGMVVGNGVQVQVIYDFNGNGSSLRTETYNYFATNPVVDWETYLQSSGQKTSSGTFANMNNGKITIKVWSAIGSGSTSLRVNASSGNGQQSTVTIPYN